MRGMQCLKKHRLNKTPMYSLVLSLLGWCLDPATKEHVGEGMLSFSQVQICTSEMFTVSM